MKKQVINTRCYVRAKILVVSSQSYFTSLSRTSWNKREFSVLHVFYSYRKEAEFDGSKLRIGSSLNRGVQLKTLLFRRVALMFLKRHGYRKNSVSPPNETDHQAETSWLLSQVKGVLLLLLLEEDFSKSLICCRMYKILK